MSKIYYNKKNNDIIFNSFKDMESNITKLQNYIPIYNNFFQINNMNYNKIILNHKFSINNIKNKINDNNYEILVNNIDNSNNLIHKHAFIKFSPLLDIIKYLVGKYTKKDKYIDELPKIENNKCYKKILSYNNSAYIDGFFSFMSSKLLNYDKFIHGVDFYGSFLGIKKELLINIDDDIEYLYNSKYFHDNKDKLYNLINFDENKLFDNDTRKYKKRIIIKTSNININDDINNIDDVMFNNMFISNLTEENVKKHSNECLIYNNTNNNNNDNSVSIKNTNSTCSSRSSNTNSDDMTDYSSLSSDSIDNDDSVDNDIHAIVYNFPVNIIIMEKLDNTLDSIIESNIDITDNEWASCLIQIIMILITYQKLFDFTHNDLHTNNIMFNKTNKKYLYYKVNSIYYKVPTYGKIYKIIDFGRSIYKYKDKVMFSDSFHHKGDAAFQYNCEPYYNKNKTKIIPNKSFDLCRLGCSLYDYFIDNMDIMDTKIKFKSPISKLIETWCKDDKGRNILYKNNGDERYEDFKLYKMIARTVHNHIPIDQLNNKIFKKFIVTRKKINKKHNIMNIDNYDKCYN